MKLDNATELFALVFNSLQGVEGANPKERLMLSERRIIILEQIKKIIMEDYQKPSAVKLTTRLLPTELESSQVKKAISEAYHD